MKKKDILNQWLANRERSYAGGLAIFNELARSIHKENYGAYFAQVDSPHIFDPHFTQLVNVLTKISMQISNEPGLYPEAETEVMEKAENVVLDETKLADEIKVRQEKIQEHEIEIDELNEKISSLEDDQEDHTIEMEELRDQLSQHEQILEDLQKEVDELSRPGVKVVTEAEMPKSIKKAYDRIKEIAPLYASLHNDIANESISEEERKKYADELCKLDDERRKLWQKIDAWSEGKEVSLDADKPVYSDNAMVRGMQLLRSRKRLKENIANSQKSAKKAQEDGKQTVYENAMKRIAQYEADLKEVETEIASAGLTE